MNTGLRVWDDAYDQHHQFLCDMDKNALFERYKITTRFDAAGINMTATSWTQWQRIVPPHRMQKAWLVRDMTVEDFILGNYDKED